MAKDSIKEKEIQRSAVGKEILNKIIPYQESVNVEFKTRFHPSIGGVISAFLNTIGGTIYIGMAEGHQFLGTNGNETEMLLHVIDEITPNPQNYVRIEEDTRFGKPLIVVTVHHPDNNLAYSYRGKVYYRIGNINRIASQNDIISILQNRRVAHGLPVMTDYFPSDKKKREEFCHIKKKNNVRYKRLGTPSKNTSYFYKYVSLDVALTIFREIYDEEKKTKIAPQTIRFVEPPSWDDQYESRFYSANYAQIDNCPESYPKLYATCFTPREESEPAWQIYNRDKEGLGKRCVQFRLNQIGLRKELIKSLKDCTIVEGRVEYKSKYDIQTLHLSTNEKGNHSKEFDKYFSSFALDNFINLLLLKRTAFEHEQEVRIFIIYDNDKSHKASTKEDATHKDIPLNWLSMLEGIKVDSKCSNIEMELLQDEINQLIDNSSILDNENLKKKLKVTRYDVNEDEERDTHIPIGETYEEFSNRMEAKKNKGKS